jgi:hypothetical protein
MHYSAPALATAEALSETCRRPCIQAAAAKKYNLFIYLKTECYRGGKSRDLLIQLSMQVSENVIVWTPLLDVI